MPQNKFPLNITGNQLKLIALICMTCDHLRHTLFPQFAFLTVIGRLAYPVFAYMIAEGCVYTKNRARYFLTIATLALVCEVVCFFAIGSLYQCILVTFSLSIGLIYLLDRARRKFCFTTAAVAIVYLLVLWFLADGLPQLLPGTDYRIDYGMMGILLPALIFMGQTKAQKLLLTAAGLCLLAIQQTSVQWFSLAALPLLALYNGKRGKWNLKYLFYIYYPLHLVVLRLLTTLLRK